MFRSWFSLDAVVVDNPDGSITWQLTDEEKKSQGAAVLKPGGDKGAMKAKDTVAMNAVRAVKGEILLFKTSEGGAKEVTDGDILKMIQKLVKQRKEAAEQYVAAGRQELADNELAEAASILLAFKRITGLLHGGTHGIF